jgi:hypothetical protein
MIDLELRFHRYLPGVQGLELAGMLSVEDYPPSTSNRIRGEHCPAVLVAARLGVVVRSACESRFSDDGEYQVLLYPTIERQTGIAGYELMTPCLVGSNEHGRGYYKIATGISFDAGEVGWIFTTPIDPRLTISGITSATGYFEPGYRGPLFAIVRPEHALTIPRGAIVGQMFPLSMQSLSLKEEASILYSSDCAESRYTVRRNVCGIQVSWRVLNTRLLECGSTDLIPFLEANGVKVDHSS